MASVQRRACQRDSCRGYLHTGSLPTLLQEEGAALGRHMRVQKCKRHVVPEQQLHYTTLIRAQPRGSTCHCYGVACKPRSSKAHVKPEALVFVNAEGREIRRPGVVEKVERPPLLCTSTQHVLKQLLTAGRNA